MSSIHISIDTLGEGQTLFKVLESCLELGKRSIFMGICNSLHGIDISTLILLSHLSGDDA